MTTPVLPRVDTAPRWRRLRGPTLAAAAVLAASVALHIRDPHQIGSWGFCPWLALTGTSCPGCGGLRAVNDLTHGDVLAAASSNLLVVAALPGAVAWWARRMRDGWRGVRRRSLPAAGVYTIAALLTALTVTFWVVRNLPAGSWLAP